MVTPTIWTPPELQFSTSDLKLIRATIPAGATAAEFDRFIAMCKVKGVNPLVGHVHMAIYNEKKADKRQVVTIISESGYLAAADRCRDSKGEPIYRPDDRPPRFKYNEKLISPDTNPKGIESVEVSVFKFVQGTWHEVPAEVFWDERAPLKEKWADNPDTGKAEPTGVFLLDKKSQWGTQPRTMLAKCARVAACRYAFPDQFGGLYAEEERDAIERGSLQVIDLTPTEVIQQAVRQEQLKAMGADKAVLFDFADGKGLVHVPLGLIHDRIEAFFLAHPEAEKIAAFTSQNRNSIKEWMGVGNKAEWIDLRGRYVDPAAAAIEAKRKVEEQRQQLENSDGKRQE